jgi:hypothetical protein
MNLNNPIGIKSFEPMKSPFMFMNPYVYGGAGGAIGGWTELGRTTLGTSGSTIDVTSIPDKRYYMVLRNILTAGADVREQFNSDTGSNYTRRYSANGGTDVTSVNDTLIGLNYSAGDKLIVDYISNLSSKEKLVLSFSSEEGTAGSGNAPNRMEVVGKWANTSDPISEISTVLSGSSYDIGSEVVVLGWDDLDTHTSNFWEELASVELGSASDTLDTGTILAKKYLWIQTFIKAVGGTVEPDMRFNNDSGGNYADRYSINGGSDGTGTSITSARGSGVPYSVFFNDFIINNALNEKLVIRQVNYPPASGVGTAPSRRETVAKWANTSDSITSIKWVDNSGGAAQMDTGSIIKVWGSD